MNQIIWTPLCLMGLLLSIWPLQRIRISITENTKFLGKTFFKLDCVLNWTYLAVSVLSGTSSIPSIYPFYSRSINKPWPRSVVCVLPTWEKWHSTGLSASQYQSRPVISQLWLTCPGHSLWDWQRPSKEQQARSQWMLRGSGGTVTFWSTWIQQQVRNPLGHIYFFLADILNWNEGVSSFPCELWSIWNVFAFSQ